MKSHFWWGVLGLFWYLCYLSWYALWAWKAFLMQLCLITAAPACHKLGHTTRRHSRCRIKPQVKLHLLSNLSHVCMSWQLARCRINNLTSWAISLMYACHDSWWANLHEDGFGGLCKLEQVLKDWSCLPCFLFHILHQREAIGKHNCKRTLTEWHENVSCTCCFWLKG